MPKEILVIEDEGSIAELVEVYLRNEGFEVQKFAAGKDALEYIKASPPDLVLLDLMLPDLDGLEICRRLRQQYTFPVIMLTAKDGEVDKITGLALGADDYITKPFRPLEMVARVKAQLRRSTRYSGRMAEDRILTFSGLVLNKDTHEATLNERQLPLTPTEFSILWYLCENRGKVVSAEELFQVVWGEKYFNGNNTVMVHIRHIREKMKDSAEHPRYIRTVWGVGYKMEG